MASGDGKKLPRLDELEHKSIDESDYKHKLKEQQLRILKLQRQLGESKRSVIVVFEGPDAAGKGGAIKRLLERLDPRLVRVYSVIKPTAEEYQRHYMWRFWNKLPAYGQAAVLDRSWYGRVLVERVEGFASDQEWKRAYREINEFERMLADDNAIIIKFYLHISKDEQLVRFKRREADPYKHWKISDEDWRNRKKWDQHNEAAEDMFEKTSTDIAPWHIVAANYKWYARLKVVKTVADRLEKSDLK
ncbi:MAG: UDP-galactose-lipid carrier transferase [Chthoniobacteraceae bacterium]